MPYVAPSTVTTLQTYTSAAHNIIVNDIIDLDSYVSPLRSAWTSFTPVFTQGANTPTFTNGYSRYIKIGRFVHLVSQVGFTSAGVVGSNIVMSFSTVATAASTSSIGGSFRYFRAGTTNYAGHVFGTSTTSALFQVNADGNQMGVGPSFAIANGDAFWIQLSFEATS